MGAKATFDGANRLVILDQVAPDVNGFVTIDAQIDLYSDAKEDWKTDTTLRKFIFLFNTIGGEDTITGETAGDFYFLRNDLGWRFRPYEADHTLIISGNVFGVDPATQILVPTIGGYTVLVIIQRSSLALTKVVEVGSAVTAQDKLDIADAVHDELLSEHTASGSAGEAFGRLDVTVGSRESETDAAARDSASQAEHDQTQADIAALNIPTAGENAVAVWEEQTAGHSTSGSFGELIQSIDLNFSTLLGDMARLLSLAGDRVQWKNLSHTNDEPPKFLSGTIVAYSDDALTLETGEAWLVQQTYDGNGATQTLTQIRVPPP